MPNSNDTCCAVLYLLPNNLEAVVEYVLIHNDVGYNGFISADGDLRVCTFTFLILTVYVRKEFANNYLVLFLKIKTLGARFFSKAI